MSSRIEPHDDDLRRDAGAELAEIGAAIRRQNRDAHRPLGSRRRRRAVRVAAQAAKPLARQGYARRRQLAPFGAALLLYVAGLVFAHSTNGANTVVLFAVPGGLLVWLRARVRVWRSPERRYAAAVYLAAVGWVQAAAIVGTAAPMPGVLVVGALAAAVPWWWHHRARPQEPDDLDDRVEVWAMRVAPQNGALPGSQLCGIGEVVNGWSATIALPAGRLTTVAAINAAGRIASAYRLPASSVVVEAPATGEEDRAQLLVLRRNPLQQVQYFTGPQLDYDTGWVTFGMHADGTPAQWRLYIPDSGACHGMIAGTTGSGKSRLVDLLCATIRLSGLSVLWLADPENGESVPDWQDSANWFAGTAHEIRRMLLSAVDVMNGRKRRRSRQRWTDNQGRERTGRGSFTPTPEEPLLVVVIEESPDVLADDVCRAAVAKIAKKGRKHGVAIYLITQVPSLAELGGDLTIRSMASSTNVVMFRTSDKMSKQMGMPSDLPVDPASLPVRWADGTSTAGLGYLAAAGGRISPMRAQYVEDPYYWATVDTAEADLESTAVSDAGQHYKTWRTRRQSGLDEEETAPDDSNSAVDMAKLVSVAVPGAARVTTRDAVLNLLSRRGQLHTGVMAKELKAPLSTVSQTLSRLEQQGLVRQVRRGIWASSMAVAEIHELAELTS